MKNFLKNLTFFLVATIAGNNLQAADTTPDQLIWQEISAFLGNKSKDSFRSLNRTNYFKCNDIYEHMDKPTYECANYIYEMAKIANKRFVLGVWMMSPRNFDRNNLEVVYKYLDNHQHPLKACKQTLLNTLFLDKL